MAYYDHAGYISLPSECSRGNGGFLLGIYLNCVLISAGGRIAALARVLAVHMFFGAAVDITLRLVASMTGTEAVKVR